MFKLVFEALTDKMFWEGLGAILIIGLLAAGAGGVVYFALKGLGVL
jgi:hypothetical protein